MASTEEPPATVLHRLIQEQLRYGNPTDTRTLLAIQQQALRGGGGGDGLGQEEGQAPQLSARQEPQGQEHHPDYQRAESGHLLPPLLQEELPSYQQAKAHSQHPGLGAYWGPGALKPSSGGDFQVEAEPVEMRRSHTRSLSERLMQVSLERGGVAMKSSSHSYPELVHCTPRGAGHGLGPHGPPPQYPGHTHGYALSPGLEPQGGPLRCVQPVAASCLNTFSTLPPAGLEEPTHLELLLMENERLKLEVEAHRAKTERIQKLEQEIQRISEAYETLMLGSSKRESLEQTLRRRLVAEIRRLQDFNRDLRENLENARSHVAQEVEAADQNQQIMAKLLEQNEEQNLERERAERELQRLRASAEEQGVRAERLEEALEVSRGRGRQLEEELRRKRAYVEKVERLQGALGQLQATCEKREALELRLRTRLEQELRSLRAQQRQSQPPGVTLSSLQERLREREEHILALEADMVRWEQKYLEESTMRQFAMDVAATAAAQRDTTIITHSPCHSSNNSFNDDLPLADLRNQEMEDRIRALYAQILEKDAVIKVLNQRMHQDQGRKDSPQWAGTGAGPTLRPTPSTLRPAPSNPAIPSSNTGASSQGTGLQGDQAGPVERLSAQSGPPSLGKSQQEGAPAREHGTGATERGDQPSQGAEGPPPDPFRGLDELESEAVEIFI